MPKMTNSCAALGLLQFRTSGQEHVAAHWWQPGDKDGQRRHPSISFSDTPQRSNFLPTYQARPLPWHG